VGATREAIIIGAGIGGLCAAIALQQKGVTVKVFERAAEIKEVGAGLSLWRNAVHALETIGLSEALHALSVPQIIGGLRSASGDLISNAMGKTFGGNAGEAQVVVLHRAELLSALLQRAGAENIKSGTECVGFAQEDQKVTARFQDGTTAGGDFLIGADGINSIIRAQMFGRSKPRYSGYTGWRAVTEFEHPFLGQGAFESWGRGARFGMIPLSGKRVYWFATKNVPQGEKDAPAGRKRELLEMFADWHEPIKAAIEKTDEQVILRNDIVDREPLKSWTQGRVTLLGDAAHAMTPNLGQGACQVIEDAVVLARCVGETGTVREALTRYEAQRLKRANKIISRSWRVGQVAQLENALACHLRNAIVKWTPAALQAKQLDWIINYEV
jgi:2-polyprenyl-6-methoxyphenol hydroxylase-like FAD-dependent oxidoreductase